MHDVALVVGVALAGAIGAPARYLMERLARTRWPSRWPWGTFVVNVSGSLALGVLVGLVLAQGLDADVRTLAGTGFLGAYTTFSTYTYETVRIAADRPPRRGLAVAYTSAVWWHQSSRPRSDSRSPARGDGTTRGDRHGRARRRSRWWSWPSTGSCRRAAAILGDWGADVVKVERPTGDPLRAIMGAGFVADTGDFNFLWELYNRNKRGIALDLRVPEGRDRVRPAHRARRRVHHQLPARRPGPSCARTPRTSWR